MAFDLKNLRRGKSVEPPRVVVAGEHGIGKSTFASSAPSPVFICTEDGLGSIDTTSFPLCTSYSQVMDAIGSLYEQSHDFSTVVLDSLDWCESLIWKHVAAAEGKKDIEEFGYGKGYVKAADAFRELLSGLNALRNDKGMAIVLTAHCEVKRYDSPTTEPYDRVQIKLHKHAAAVVQEWADVVGFAAEEVRTRAEDVGFGKKARRAIGTGSRVLHVTPTPAFTAKNRYGMPDTIPLDWAAFQAAITP